MGDSNHRPADLMLHVAHCLLVLGPHPCPGSAQPRVPTTAFVFPTERTAQFRKALGVPLLLVPALPTSDDGCGMLVTYNRWMDLAEIDRDDVGARCQFGLFPILSHQVPGVAVGALVIDKSD